jgi:hypothetical protein
MAQRQQGRLDAQIWWSWCKPQDTDQRTPDPSRAYGMFTTLVPNNHLFKFICSI